MEMRLEVGTGIGHGGITDIILRLKLYQCH